MNIELTKAELDMIVALMDAGIKNIGLQAVKPEVLSIIQKFSLAIQNANKPKEDSLNGSN